MTDRYASTAAPCPIHPAQTQPCPVCITVVVPLAAPAQPATDNAALIAETKVAAAAAWTRSAMATYKLLTRLAAALAAAEARVTQMTAERDKCCGEACDFEYRAEQAEAQLADVFRRIENGTMHRLICNGDHNSPIGGGSCICVPQHIKQRIAQAEARNAELIAMHKALMADADKRAEQAEARGAEANAKDAHLGRWVNNNLRRLLALHRADSYSAGQFYESVKRQLELADAALARLGE